MPNTSTGAPKNWRRNATNFNAWECKSKRELIVWISASRPYPKRARNALEDVYRLSWFRQARGHIAVGANKDGEIIANDILTWDYAAKDEFHLMLGWSKECDTLPNYHTHFDSEENKEYKAPVCLSLKDIREGSKTWLNMNQSSVLIITDAKLDKEDEDTILNELKRYRVESSVIVKPIISEKDPSQNRLNKICDFTIELELSNKALSKEKHGLEITDEQEDALSGEAADIDEVTARDKAVSKIDRNFVKVTSQGKNYAVRWKEDALGYKELEFFTFKSMREMHIQEPDVWDGEYDRYGNQVMVNPAHAWLSDINSRWAPQGITFYPIDKEFIGGKYNAYSGLGYREGQFKYSLIKKWLKHVKRVIAGNDSDTFKYIVKWLAHMIQKPWEKPEVALALLSGEGSGKGLFVKPLGRIMASHFFHALNSNHILGKFNSLMEVAILVFADECFAGSKEATDILKGMITEIINYIERKGIDKAKIQSFVRIIFASNREGFINISLSDRRFFFAPVSMERKGDFEYFASLADEQEHTGFHESLIGFLNSVDITNYNPRTRPASEKLNESKLDHLEPLDQFFLWWFRQGSLQGMRIENTTEPRMKSSEFTNLVESWLQERKLRVMGDIPTKVGKKIRELDIGKKARYRREYFYEFEEIDILRKKFSDYLGFDVEY